MLAGIKDEPLCIGGQTIRYRLPCQPVCCLLRLPLAHPDSVKIGVRQRATYAENWLYHAASC